jgi:seryl-tRNA synthetase
MPSSSDIQKSIDSIVSSREAWNKELLDYNKRLSSAKKLSEKNSLRKSIKNAEDQIKDLDRQQNKLQNDLKKATILESDKPTKFETLLSTAKDITTKLVDKGDLPSLNDLSNRTKSADVPGDSSTGPSVTLAPDLKKKMITYGIIGVILLILLIKKR